MLKFSLVLCLTIQLAYTKPWFHHDSSYQSEENGSDLEETVDTWITKTDRNEKKINIIQDQIEEIGDVLEGQSEMIGKLQDLISFGQRPFDENLMMNGEEEEEFMNEPTPMNFDNEEEHSDEVENSEQEEESFDEVEDSETGEVEDVENEAKEENFEDLSETGEEVEPTESDEQENVTESYVSDENKETLEEGK
ncbi:coiled-coil domain-containing glutamate-rich protein 1-like [Mytilus trossulus]|uniref:coiled-coil domain-containing glutamate-rich protein 1-like n=1 Tax=Mytilus trossulus TaxID=6551 RepID=UPI003004B51C